MDNKDLIRHISQSVVESLTPLLKAIDIRLDTIESRLNTIEDRLDVVETKQRADSELIHRMADETSKHFEYLKRKHLDHDFRISKLESQFGSA